METGKTKTQVQAQAEKQTQVIKANVSGAAAVQQNVELTDATKEKKLLRTPRNRKYVKLIKQIDQLTKKDEEIIEMVRSMPVQNKLLGILSECQIEGCIIHAIDKFGNILEHYHSVEEMPEELRDGYSVYLENKNCTCIEVYTNTICVVNADGMVKFVDRE